MCAASVVKGLYYLDRAPSKTSAVCLLTGAGTRLTKGKLQCGTGACLVMDSSCADWVFSNVVFKGTALKFVPLHIYCLVPEHLINTPSSPNNNVQLVHNLEVQLAPDHSSHLQHSSLACSFSAQHSVPVPFCLLNIDRWRYELVANELVINMFFFHICSQKIYLFSSTQHIHNLYNYYVTYLVP